MRPWGRGPNFGPALKRRLIATEALLTTKLYVPQAHPNLVPRPRLAELLAEGMNRKLTLVSAPAGFGKTTLLSEWRMLHLDSGWAIGWVSLDEGDNDFRRFLSYLIAALQAIDEGAGENVLMLLRSPQLPPMETVITVLINDVAQISEDFTLVLDDYHVIEEELIHGALTFLLEHLPPQMHLVIASRTNPPLPLALLRSRGHMTELRADDLRFGPEEAAAFLNGVMGLDLSTKEIEALEERTEGWIAGLQLAALSMQGREDVSRFVEAFTGSNRYVVDYLVEEVLARQPEPVTSFLLMTSILDRMSGELCDAITETDGGQEMLEALERENLFVIALDEERRWYRYHHLFAEVLRHHLRRSRPELVPELHRRASKWHEQNELIDEAIGHALAARDFERAARLIEEATGTMLRRGEIAMLLGWLEALPENLLSSRPQLGTAHAWALLLAGRTEEAEERALALEGNAGVSAEDYGRVAAARAYVARAHGNLPLSVDLSNRALRHLPEDDADLRAVIALNLGSTHWTSGELAAAEAALVEASTASRKAGNVYVALAANRWLAQLETMRGRLHRAVDLYEQGFQLAGDRPVPAAALAHTGMGEILYERNDLEGATRHLDRAIELSESSGGATIVFPARALLAKVKGARGDAEEALRVILEDERGASGMDLQDQIRTTIAAHGARLELARGNTNAAARFLEERGVPADEPDHTNELEHLVWARVLLAKGEATEALKLLDRLLDEAEASGRMGSVIGILAVRALAYEALSEEARALAGLGRALALAEPEGYVRTFVDLGAPMAALLRRAASGGSSEYVDKLLVAFQQPSGHGPSRAASGSPRAVQLLPEPLSERELEVLRLVAAGKPNREISGQLFVSVDTVKKHLTHVFRKLGVSSRTQAVARARELGLVP